MPDGTKFCWTVDSYREQWSGHEDSREACLEQARLDHPEATTVWTGVQVPHLASEFFKASRIIDAAREAAYEESEHADDWPDIDPRGPEAVELQAVLDAWCAKHVKRVPFWTVDEEQEHYWDMTAGSPAYPDGEWALRKIVL